MAARCWQWVEPTPKSFSHLPIPIPGWDLLLGQKGWMRTLPVAAWMVGHGCIAEGDCSSDLRWENGHLPSHAGLQRPARCTLCYDTHTCIHTHITYQPHMDNSRLPANGNCCPFQARLTLKMLSGGGLRCQAFSVQAQLPHLMTCLPLLPQALCDLSPCSYTTVSARVKSQASDSFLAHRPSHLLSFCHLTHE